MEKSKSRTLIISLGLMVFGLIIGGIGVLYGGIDNFVFPDLITKVINLF